MSPRLHRKGVTAPAWYPVLIEPTPDISDQPPLDYPFPLISRISLSLLHLAPFLSTALARYTRPPAVSSKLNPNSTSNSTWEENAPTAVETGQQSAMTVTAPAAATARGAEGKNAMCARAQASSTPIIEVASKTLGHLREQSRGYGLGGSGSSRLCVVVITAQSPVVNIHRHPTRHLSIVQVTDRPPQNTP
ncbi:hypothetical protein P153DRAFT_386303 [Dothidotthia symphoricarpi CBS 119687]|uniref:Uncharacterized protein n=1 Tax=Dothidotthia symphoricarpi CBS 119687 TaxID=1392245 RepID=A0A6A6ADB4_9PLEO|nr:uncharacterized protein P153DRAFT_386303 [Dothidotthia symphoricarpi CBS 119687]KAF2129115.1 hypothetical protein P153DRAFT_386303 [Dothidotthia symphoricarpi CBS 119687]